MAGDSVSEVIICEKAKQLFEELSAKAKAVGLERITPNYIYVGKSESKVPYSIATK